MLYEYDALPCIKLKYERNSPTETDCNSELFSLLQSPKTHTQSLSISIVRSSNIIRIANHLAFKFNHKNINIKISMSSVII